MKKKNKIKWYQAKKQICIQIIILFLENMIVVRKIFIK